MAASENILESILEEDEEETFEDDDVDMIDADGYEDGEIPDDKQLQQLSIQSTDKHVVTDGSVITDSVVTDSNQENPAKRKKRKNRNKNKRKKPKTVTTITDVNRFVIDTCRRLKEKKQYLLWNAVGCLGVAAVAEIVKEVDAIQACGGQMTADGKRYRNGGGILWNILKTREPNAYKEIMTKGRELERSFRKPNSRQGVKEDKSTTSSEISDAAPSDQTESQASSYQGRRVSALDRLRVPVSYDDLLVEDEAKDRQHDCPENELALP